MDLEEAFPNDPRFVAKRVLTEGTHRRVPGLRENTRIVLQVIGEEVAVALINTSEPGRSPEWLAKKARDGVQKALEGTLFASMNVALGLPEDYRP